MTDKIPMGHSIQPEDIQDLGQALLDDDPVTRAKRHREEDKALVGRVLGSPQHPNQSLSPSLVGPALFPVTPFPLPGLPLYLEEE